MTEDTFVLMLLAAGDALAILATLDSVLPGRGTP
jgi:hypothetical protein